MQVIKMNNSNLVKRMPLAEVVPLNAPLSVHIYPSSKCNFKCNYCIHSLSSEEMRLQGFERTKMSYDMYEKIINGIEKFPRPLKALMFAGHGEPFTNPSLPKMIRLAKDRGIADRVEVTTNGSLLTYPLIDELIDSRVDRLKISIQGVSSEKYKSIAKYNIDIDDFTARLRYFKKNKKGTEIYIKIIDSALETDAEKNKFFNIFSDCADFLDVEYLIPFYSGIDHLSLKNTFDRCKQGHSRSSKTCSMPFYMLVVNTDGTVTPCCSSDYPLILGNAVKDSLYNIWNSHILHNFQRDLLSAKLTGVCSTCSVPKYGLQEGDYLDNHLEEIVERFESR